jgi:hypothetical protein
MGQMTMEVIEEAASLHGSRFTLRLSKNITRATLEPQGETLAFSQGNDGTVQFGIDYFVNHQMVALHYEK